MTLGCEQEEDIVAAARFGNWTPALYDHFTRCSSCAEQVLTIELLRSELHNACSQVQLPDAGRVWWTALLRNRQAAAERAVVPVQIVEKIALVTGVLSVAFALTHYWQQPAPWLANLAAQSSGFLNIVWLLAGSVCFLIAFAGLSYLLADSC